MRIELLNNRYLLCGHILSTAFVRVGQVWAPASGGNYEVTITDVTDGWVTYEWNEWDESGIIKHHSKDSFSFQCRYCLVIDKVE